MLLGVAGVSILSAFPNAVRTTQAPESAAYGLAARQLASMTEFVRQDTWNDAATNPLVATGVPVNLGNETLGRWTFTRTYQVNPDAGAAVDGDGYRRVRVRVSWP